MQPERRLFTEILQNVAEFCNDSTLQTLSQLSKRDRTDTAQIRQRRLDQTASIQKMCALWKDIDPSHAIRFRNKQDSSRRNKIIQFLHGFDGELDEKLMNPHRHNQTRELALFLRDSLRRYRNEYPSEFEVSSHRFERNRRDLSDDEMSVFDEYVRLYKECRELTRTKGPISSRTKLRNYVWWIKLMESIGADIGYPNIVVIREFDDLRGMSPIEGLCSKVIPSVRKRWIKVRDRRLERLNMFDRALKAIDPRNNEATLRLMAASGRTEQRVTGVMGLFENDREFVMIMMIAAFVWMILFRDYVMKTRREAFV